MDTRFYEGKIVKATAKIEDLDDYLEPGMMCRIQSIKLNAHRDTFVVTIDTSEFEDHNIPLESANYYDKNGSPCLTAHQAGHYEPVQEYFIEPSIDVFGKYFTLIDDAGEINALIREFNARPDKAVGYVAWLEQELLQARADAKV